MNQIYKFSDPKSEFSHYILSKDIKKTLKYLDYLYRNFVNKVSGFKEVNSPLVQYLMQNKRPFNEIKMELIFETEDREVAEATLLECKQGTYQTSTVEPPVSDEVPTEVSNSDAETTIEDTVQSTVEESVENTPTPKKRGRKKKVV